MYMGFDAGKFYDFLSEKHKFDKYEDAFAIDLVQNIVGYAHENEHVVKDQFAQFITDMIPGLRSLKWQASVKTKYLRITR